MKVLKTVNPVFFCAFFLLGSLMVVRGQEKGSEARLIGEHAFGVQFIWEGYGKAVIVEDEEEVLYISAEQYSKNKEEYVLLEGELTVLDDRHFRVKGHLKLFTEGCCGLLDRNVNYTFRKTGARNYWRLKERDELCDPYTCAYYLDIFE